MKYIKLSLQYMYHNIWYVLLFAIVPSLLLGFLTNPASNMEFIRDFANLHTFTEIFSAMSELNLKNFLIALPVFPVLLVIFSAASGIISKHMRRGIFNFNKFFRSVNNNIMYTLVVGFSLLAAFELAALLNASFATLWIRSFGNGRIGLTLSIVTMSVSWIILLLIATVSLLWLPTMSVTGLNPAKALAESFRSLKGKIWKVLFAIALPLVFYFAICAPLSYFVVPARQFVYTLVYLFMLPYALILMFAVYCDVNDIDREDLRVRAFRKKGISHADIADDDNYNATISLSASVINDEQTVNIEKEPNFTNSVEGTEQAVITETDSISIVAETSSDIINNTEMCKDSDELDNKSDAGEARTDSADNNDSKNLNNDDIENTNDLNTKTTVKKTESGAKKRKTSGGK